MNTPSRFHESARRLTPPQVARQYGVAPETVVNWIRSGELRAINVAAHGTKRPRFRIDPADLAAFEAAREVAAPVQAARGRRRQPALNYVEYV